MRSLFPGSLMDSHLKIFNLIVLPAYALALLTNGLQGQVDSF